MDSTRRLPNYTVVTHGGRITALGPTETMRLPPGTRTIDGTGRFLIPGLADLHVHPFSRDDFLSYVASGVTTFGNMDGAPWDLRWREALSTGTLCCGTLLTAGSTVDGRPLNWMFTAAQTPEQAQQIVASQRAAGYDFIKAYSTLKPTVYAALLRAAAAQQIAVVGHLPRWIRSDTVFRMGQLMVAHGEELYYTVFAGMPDSSKLRGVADDLRNAGVVVTPNLVAYRRIIQEIEHLPAILADAETRYVPPSTLHQWIPANNRYNVLNRFADPSDPPPAVQAAQFRAVQGFLRLMTRALNDGGVPLILGTDSPAIGFAGLSAQEELQEMVAAGLTPFQALSAATRNAGDFAVRVHPDRPRFGVIAVGQRADLVLLRRDPLTDIRNASAIEGVMVRGRWLPSKTIREMRDATARKYPAAKALMFAWDRLVDAHDMAGARRVFDRARLARGREPFLSQWVVYTKGRVELENGNGDAAVALFHMNAELYPEHHAVYSDLGRALLAVHDTVQARTAFETALRLAPGDGVSIEALRRIDPVH